MGALRIRLNFLLGMDWGNPMKCHSTRSFCRYFLGKDWDPIFRDNFCQQFPNVLSVVDGVAELPKLILQDFVVEGLILPNVDQVVFGLPYFLVGQQKFLKELLARAQTGVDNGKSTSGSKPDKRIMLRARSSIRTGSPISRMKISPPLA